MANDAEAGHGAVIDQGKAGAGDLWRHPGARKTVAWCREKGPVEVDDCFAERPVDAPQAFIARHFGRDRGAVAYFAVGEHEARFPIVVLLIDHAVEADGASVELRHAGLPGLPAVALAAIVGPANVETDEAVVGAIAHRRDAGDQLARQPRADEAAGVGAVERIAVVEAWVPPLVGGSFDRRVEFATGHGVNVEDACHDCNIV